MEERAARVVEREERALRRCGSSRGTRAPARVGRSRTRAAADVRRRDGMDRREGGSRAAREVDAVDAALARVDEHGRLARVARSRARSGRAARPRRGARASAPSRAPHDEVARRATVQDLERAVAVEVGELDAPHVLLRARSRRARPRASRRSSPRRPVAPTGRGRARRPLEIAEGEPRRAGSTARGSRPRRRRCRPGRVAAAAHVRGRARPAPSTGWRSAGVGPVAGLLEPERGRLAGRCRLGPHAAVSDDAQRARPRAPHRRRRRATSSSTSVQRTTTSTP